MPLGTLATLREGIQQQAKRPNAVGFTNEEERHTENTQHIADNIERIDNPRILLGKILLYLVYCLPYSLPYTIPT